MFGIFKNPNSFKSKSEFREYCENLFDKTAVDSYKNNPLKGTPLDAFAVITGFSNCLKNLESRIQEISKKNNWNIEEVESVIYESYRKVHDKYITY